MSKVEITVTKRPSSEVFDLEVTRDGRLFGTISNVRSAEQVEVIRTKIDAIDESDPKYRAKVWSIMRAKGSDFVLGFSGKRYDKGTIHRTTCGQVLRKMGSLNGGSLYDVDLAKVVEERALTRSPLPEVCGLCAKDVVLA